MPFLFTIAHGFVIYLITVPNSQQCIEIYLNYLVLLQATFKALLQTKA